MMFRSLYLELPHHYAQRDVETIKLCSTACRQWSLCSLQRDRDLLDAADLEEAKWLTIYDGSGRTTKKR